MTGVASKTTTLQKKMGPLYTYYSHYHHQHHTYLHIECTPIYHIDAAFAESTIARITATVATWWMQAFSACCRRIQLSTSLLVPTALP